MGVHIDKPGRDDLAGNIDFARTRHLRKPRPDRGNPVAGDSDIRWVARPAGAVDDDAAAQDHIDHREFPALLMSE